MQRESLALKVCAALSLTISLAAGHANAVGVVTFYNNQSSFLAAVSSPTVLNFEGIVTDTGIHGVGASYHTGAVTFTSPTHGLQVVGSHAQALGAPFDSAILIPTTTPSSIIATFDPGSNVTAVGGYFLDLFGTQPGLFTLTGSTGVLDTRFLATGIATAGHPHTFIGFTVTGDVISSLSVDMNPDAPAFDDFTYGTAIPAPASASLILIGSTGLLRRRRKY